MGPVEIGTAVSDTDAGIPGVGAEPQSLWAMIPDRTLREAAQLVAERVTEDGPVGGSSALIGELALIARAVSLPECRGSVSPATVQSGIERRRLLDYLRGAVVESWGETPASAGEMLDRLRAFEAVQAELAPGWDDEFAVSLSQPTSHELLTEVAHDLRSPLTSIIFLSEFMRLGRSGGISAAQRRQLGLIYSAAQGLSSMVNDLVEVARDGGDLVEEEPAEFSVSALMESVREIVQPIAEERGLTLRLVPPRPDLRHGYPTALGRVLLNLVTNALRCTDEGYVELLAQPRGRGSIEFSVRDTSRGIDTEVADSLFRPFLRSEGGNRTRFSSSGLALTISRRLIEAMGSRLEYETASDWGTEFYFVLELPEAAAI